MSVALRTQHDCALVNEMRAVRDKQASGSAKFREICDTPSFGSSLADTKMSNAALALQDDFPGGNMREELDKNIYTRLLLASASASEEYFRSNLLHLFSGANFQKGYARSPTHKPEELTIRIAPVKGLERALVKFDEYASEVEQWPVAPQIRDVLRCTIEAPNGDAFADATKAIMTSFSMREGNGRMKNNLMSTKHQPPNLLMNVVICPPDMPPITAEIQLYLQEIEELNEHHYYEVQGSV